MHVNTKHDALRRRLGRQAEEKTTDTQYLLNLHTRLKNKSDQHHQSIYTNCERKPSHTPYSLPAHRLNNSSFINTPVPLAHDSLNMQVQKREREREKTRQTHTNFSSEPPHHEVHDTNSSTVDTRIKELQKHSAARIMTPGIRRSGVNDDTRN